jgi:hypothetical protein
MGKLRANYLPSKEYICTNQGWDGCLTSPPEATKTALPKRKEIFKRL